MSEFLICSKYIVPRENAGPHREAHQNFIRGLSERGELVMAGSFQDGSGGLYIIKADSLESARSTAESDPYHLNGVRKFEVHP